jgi:hypothetical protein
MQLKLMHSTMHSLLLALTPQTVNATDKEKLLYGVEDSEYFIQDTWQVQCNGLFGFQRVLTTSTIAPALRCSQCAHCLLR